MAHFSKILGLAGTALVFAGMAFGQATCGAPSAVGLGIIRAEGTTEQVAQLTFTCTSTTAIGAAGTATLQLFLSPSLPVTSKVLSSSSGATEAVVSVNGGPNVNATVSGSTINFSSIGLPALAAANCGANFCYVFLVSNVRVNATSLTVGSGVPPTVSELGFISGSAPNINPAALASTQVAFAQNGLGSVKLNKTFTTATAQVSPGPPAVTAGFPNGSAGSGGANNFVICNPYSPNKDGAALATVGVKAGSSLAFVVSLSENFATAFKTAAGEASIVPTAVGGTSNAVVDGTRLQLNFSNVPSNVTLYVPNGTIQATNGQGAMPPAVATGAIQLTGSAPGTAFAAVAGSGSSSITGGGTGLTTANGLAPVTLSSGAGSAVFEVITSDTTSLDVYNIPVFIVQTANSVAGSTTPISVSASFSPVGSTVIPNFAVTSSTTTLTGSTFNLCTTSMLFPFVTNQLGFDTGIAISNTSTDPFGSAGATPQAGTCTLSFYGNGAPSPSSVATPNVPSGSVYAQVLSSLAAGFQGYMIAQCNFQYAHGFAFVTDGVGPLGGLSQGYLAGIIPDVNQVSRGANPLSVAPPGTGESLGN